MKKIFLPTDFSDNARLSLDYAAQLCAGEAVEYIIVHVIAPTPLLVTSDELVEFIPTDNPPDLELEKKHLESKINNPDSKVSIISRKGGLSTILKKEGANMKVDLIIMSPRGAGKSYGFGSNTLAVMKSSEIPVLIVMEDKEFRPFNKILFASDLMGYSKPPFVFPLDYFINQFNSEVEVVHYGKNEPGTKEQFMQELIETFGEERTHVEYVNEENVLDGLNSTIESLQPDLLVLVNRHRWFFSQLFIKSVTRSMIVDSPIPILILHDKA